MNANGKGRSRAFHTVIWACVVASSAACVVRDEPTAVPFKGPFAAPVIMGGAYTVIDLGVLPGGTWSYATAINDQGDVAGTAAGGHTGCPDQPVAFLHRNGAFINLHAAKPVGAMCDGFSNATAVNDSGVVAGSIGQVGTPNIGVLPFVWRQGTMRLLLPNETVAGNGFDINDKGTVVGTFVPKHNVSVRRGFIIGRPIPQIDAVIYRINDLGVATGIVGSTPTIWRPDGSSQALPMPPSSLPVPLNNRGGFVFASNAGWAHFAEGRVKILGTPGGQPTDISDRGRIAGHVFFTAGLPAAATWKSGVFTVLPLIVPGTASYAEAVNTCGAIAGRAIAPNGAEHAVVWKPATCD